MHYPSDVIAGALLGISVFFAVLALFNWAKKNIKADKFKVVFVLTIITFTFLRFLYIRAGLLDLSTDEAHYWEWSRRLDLSYYSKGPMIAYLIAFTTWLMGDTVLGIRCFAPVFLALGSILIYKLAKEIFNSKIAAAAAIAFQLTPLYSAYGVVMTIDSPFIFFWALALYLFWKAVNNQKSEVRIIEPHPLSPPFDKGGRGGLLRITHHTSLSYWLLLGITIGLGLLTKYTMAFFYVCAFLFVVFSKEHRRWLEKKEPYICLAVSLAVFSPVIIWNAGQDWVTLKHTAGQAHISEGVRISFKNFFEFLGSQIGVLTPLLFAAVLYGAVKNIVASCKPQAVSETLNPPSPPFDKGGTGGFLRITHNASLFLFCFWAPALGFFILKSLQAKVQANWALPAYITAFIASSGFFLYSDAVKKSTKVFLSISIIMAFGLTLI
ncbi:MAG: glycosyltransferase family 39 protein, partial [Nitrospirae bacterium]|nr:glycosyltransferase family 39 protein [Nitrospirota bacterium]